LRSSERRSHGIPNSQKDTSGIPDILNITKSDNFDAFLSYDSTTKKFTVLQDFDALIVPWVYSWKTAGSTTSEGKFYINDVQMVYFKCITKNIGNIAGQPFAAHLLKDDEMWSNRPNTNGYAQQMLKIYRSLLPADNLPDAMTLANEV
jgi:hypothetical protein